MLTAAQFQQWCRRLRLSPETQEHIARLRALPPVRRVSSRAQNVRGAYASRKMGCTLQFESHMVISTKSEQVLGPRVSTQREE